MVAASAVQKADSHESKIPVGKKRRDDNCIHLASGRIPKRLMLNLQEETDGKIGCFKKVTSTKEPILHLLKRLVHVLFIFSNKTSIEKSVKCALQADLKLMKTGEKSNGYLRRFPCLGTRK